jgi:5'-nucleotidase
MRRASRARPWLVLLWLAACGLLAPAGAQPRPQPPPYRILVTNDDGVHAPGLAALAQVLQAIGNVTVIAPSDPQSGKGHSIITREPIFREELTLANGLKAIGLSATPASTVNVALLNILSPLPDLVVSGINHGYNLAYSAYLSGTVGAAREAAMHGVPAIAAALAEAGSPRDLVPAAEEVLGVARRVKQFGLPSSTFLSVNIPPMPPGGYKGYMVTAQAMARGGNESFAETKHPSGRTIYWNVYREGVANPPEGTDIWAVENGYVSVSPLRVGELDRTQQEALRNWFR